MIDRIARFGRGFTQAVRQKVGHGVAEAGKLAIGMAERLAGALGITMRARAVGLRRGQEVSMALKTRAVGGLVSAARRRLGLTPQALAARLGYTNVDGGARRVLAVENGRSARGELFERIVEELAIPREAIDTAREHDERDRVAAYLARAAERVEPSVVVRWIPGFYLAEPIPEGLVSAEDLERYARGVAMRRERKVCLTLATGVTVWINERGEVEGRRERTPGGSARTPRMTFDGRTLPKRPG